MSHLGLIDTRAREALRWAIATGVTAVAKKQKSKARKPATEPQIKIVGTNIIIDGISYRIPKFLLDSPTEQLIAFYKGWHPRS
jgi:hypothetical protein